jgi:hypothetical protein
VQIDISQEKAWLSLISLAKTGINIRNQFRKMKRINAGIFKTFESTRNEKNGWEFLGTCSAGGVPFW